MGTTIYGIYKAAARCRITKTGRNSQPISIISLDHNDITISKDLKRIITGL